MSNDKPARNIVLSPGTNPIDDFNIRYVFYCEQILKEIHRQQIQRKITKDSTPVKVEEELRSCMMTILQRFGVRDFEQPVKCGYFCQLTNELQSQDLIPIILNNQVNCTLDHTSFKHRIHTVKIPEYQIEELQALLRGPEHMMMYDVECDMGERDLYTFSNWVALQGELFVREAADRLKWHPFKQKEEITIEVITFTINQTISTVKEFRDMGISTVEIVKMMWLDLFDEAVSLQLNIEQT